MERFEREQQAGLGESKRKPNQHQNNSTEEKEMIGRTKTKITVRIRLAGFIWPKLIKIISSSSSLMARELALRPWQWFG